MGSRRDVLKLLSKILASFAFMFSVPLHSKNQSSIADNTEKLIKRIKGRVFTRADKEYESRRRGMSWQFRKTSRKPDILVQAKNSDDLLTAVKFAKENKLKVGIRTGGHSWVHSAIREGGMLLDLGEFKSLEIDEENTTAIAGPALTARELASALAEKGLAFPVAHCSTVALGGYLLGGGQAWNGAHWGGAACHSIKALEVVTADGDLSLIDSHNNEDLFWAGKGAGPGFPAVVSAYHLNLYPLPTAMRMSTYIWPLSDTLSVSEWLQTVAVELSDKVEVLMFLSTLPEAINDISKVVIISAVAFADTHEEAKTIMAPLNTANNIATPLVVEVLKPVVFDDLFNLVDQSFFPCRAAADTFWFDLSMKAVMEKYIEHFASAPSPYSNVLCEVIAGPSKEKNGAYSMRRSTYLSPYAFWLNAKDDKENLAWMQKTQEILAPLSVGHYINEADLYASSGRSQDSFSEASWQGIKQVQAKYDPESLFHTYPEHSSR
jgi:FAD/FMN-containing dehydrogenase